MTLIKYSEKCFKLSIGCFSDGFMYPENILILKYECSESRYNELLKNKIFVDDNGSSLKLNTSFKNNLKIIDFIDKMNVYNIKWDVTTVYTYDEIVNDGSFLEFLYQDDNDKLIARLLWE